MISSVHQSNNNWKKCCCAVCGIYHASVKSAQNHQRDCRRKGPQPPQAVAPLQPEVRQRPVRIAARRQREMMVILRDHLNSETAEWLNWHRRRRMRPTGAAATSTWCWHACHRQHRTMGSYSLAGCSVGLSNRDILFLIRTLCTLCSVLRLDWSRLRSVHQLLEIKCLLCNRLYYMHGCIDCLRELRVWQNNLGIVASLLKPIYQLKWLILMK